MPKKKDRFVHGRWMLVDKTQPRSTDRKLNSVVAASGFVTPSGDLWNMLYPMAL